MKLFARLLLVVILFVSVGTVYHAFADNTNTYVIKKNITDSLIGIVPESVDTDPNYRVFAIIHLSDDIINGYRQKVKPSNNSPPLTGISGLEVLI